MIITDTYIFIKGYVYDRQLIDRIIRLASDSSIENIVIDGFCGMGGVTEGFSRLPNWMVIACINHWDVAIATHQKNHPDCLHLLEDFRSADLTIIRYIVSEIKKRNPYVHVHCWFSLECTNFSNAKGGMSRDADSRTLAEHTDRYLVELDPDTVWIENVKEFLLWGPMIPKVISVFKRKKKTEYVPKGVDPVEYYTNLVEKGHVLTCPMVVKKKQPIPQPWMIPCPDRKGEDFKRWENYTCSFGYEVEKKVLNCADYGVPQHRIRLIMQFARPGNMINWPEKTHDKKAANGLPKWKPVKPCLDLDDEGEDVLSFKMKKGKLVPRITSEATVDRLMNGCTRHVLPTKESNFIVKYNSNNLETGSNNGVSVYEVSPAATAQQRTAIAKVQMLDYYFGNGYTKPVSEPAGVSGTKDGISLITTSHFLDMQYSSGQKDKSVDDVAGAILGVPKQQIVEVEHLIMDTNFSNAAHTLEQPARTQTASRKHFYLVNFQWFNESFRDIDRPSNTAIARMDKSPNYLIVLETGELAIEVFEHDPPHYVKLKKFMAENGIISIKMRMLKEKELLRIMTIPDVTKMSRSSTNNKKMIGNAVPSDLVEKLGAAYKANRTDEIAA